MRIGRLPGIEPGRLAKQQTQRQAQQPQAKCQRRQQRRECQQDRSIVKLAAIHCQAVTQEDDSPAQQRYGQRKGVCGCAAATNSAASNGLRFVDAEELFVVARDPAACQLVFVNAGAYAEEDIFARQVRQGQTNVKVARFAFGQRRQLFNIRNLSVFVLGDDNLGCDSPRRATIAHLEADDGMRHIIAVTDTRGGVME